MAQPFRTIGPFVKTIDESPPIRGDNESRREDMRVFESFKSQTGTDAKRTWKPFRRSNANDTPSELRKREFKSCLNKLTVEKFPCLVEQMAQIMRIVESDDEIQCIVNMVISKCLTEPNFSELYADLTMVLRWCSCYVTPRSGSTQSSNLEKPAVCKTVASGGDAAARHFTSVLLSSLQQEFELRTESFETLGGREHVACEEASGALKDMKVEMMCLCTLVGDLYVRELVKSSVVQSIVQRLLGFTDIEKGINEHFVECVCAFCCSAGAFMETRPATSAFLRQIMGRLCEIQMLQETSPRLRFILQDILDAKKVHWHQRSHREKAKTLLQIRDDAERVEAAGGEHVVAQAGKVERLGERTNLQNAEYANYISHQKEMYQHKIVADGPR